MKIISSLALCALVGAATSISGQVKHDPAALMADSQLLQAPMELSLAPSKTSTVYHAETGQWQFNLHSYLAWHQGEFWAVWSAGKVDEDSGKQRIHYATSPDGHNWSAPGILAEDPDGAEGPALWIARGVYSQGKHLYALAAYSEGHFQKNGQTESWHNLKLVRFEWTGKGWQKLGTYVDDCMNNFPPRPFGDHLFMTCRDSYSQMHTAVSDNLSGDHWSVSPLPASVPPSNMSEPSWYIDPQGTGHILFRDAGRSKFLYHSTSTDQGRTWSAPVRTNYPDATSKNFATKLSNGWYFLINNPNQKKRDPLGISFSRDGWSFSHPMALRKDAPALRFKGKHKGTGSFQYPHAIEHDGSLWVIYSVNKEDIEVSEFTLSSFGFSK